MEANENIDKAKEDYLAGMKYKDIASKYDVSLSTVKSWKTRYKWTRKKGMQTKQKSTRTKSKSMHTKKVAKIISENDDTNEHQKQFCLLYLQSFNATRAYQDAYGCSYETAMTNGPALLRNTQIKQLIQKCHEEISMDVIATKTDAINSMLKISKSRIGDFVKVVTQKVIDPDVLNADGTPHTYCTVQVIPKDINNMDTSLIKSISSGRDGFKLDLFDKNAILKELLKVLPEGKTNAKDDPVIKAVRQAAETGEGKIDANDIEE
ncbi:terminase small subunit [Apilactobacillus timberlakei]|uniref:Terminase n=1 Tax=Apilactobacillus timberlakei TaxID=2008380 RepID=A0ABY2YRI4_9LACO|nr:terminase small subunit [Apilactobacillus timberlakei]TPR12752.1 terminase [Apilactobacillus timberlakei]TPR13635.1 terminase [Apilactobacillus timberlakei]